MNTTIPLDTPSRRFPTDVTSSIPDQYRGSSGPPNCDGSQKIDPQPESPNKDAVKSPDSQAG